MVGRLEFSKVWVVLAGKELHGDATWENGQIVPLIPSGEVRSPMKLVVVQARGGCITLRSLTWSLTYNELRTTTVHKRNGKGLNNFGAGAGFTIDYSQNY
jgi:hypothetical protein